jgi:hypothetical protein
MQTEFGKIAHLTQTMGEELSPLRNENATSIRDRHDDFGLVGAILVQVAYVHVSLKRECLHGEK